MVIHLFADIAPKTVENFRKLCAESYRRPDGKVLTYKGSKIHRIIPDFIIQGGDVLTSYGTSSESIYGGYFEDENFVFNHDKEGLLSIANKGPNTNGSQFFITLSITFLKHFNLVKSMFCIRPVQGASCLPPDDSWDRLQHPTTTQKDKRFR